MRWCTSGAALHNEDILSDNSGFTNKYYDPNYKEKNITKPLVGYFNPGLTEGPSYQVPTILLVVETF